MSREYCTAIFIIPIAFPFSHWKVPYRSFLLLSSPTCLCRCCCRCWGQATLSQNKKHTENVWIHPACLERLTRSEGDRIIIETLNWKNGKSGIHIFFILQILLNVIQTLWKEKLKKKIGKIIFWKLTNFCFFFLVHSVMYLSYILLVTFFLFFYEFVISGTYGEYPHEHWMKKKKMKIGKAQKILIVSKVYDTHILSNVLFCIQYSIACEYLKYRRIKKLCINRKNLQFPINVMMMMKKYVTIMTNMNISPIIQQQQKRISSLTTYTHMCVCVSASISLLCSEFGFFVY